MSYETDYWYVRDGENVAGPFTRAELEGRCHRGEVDWYHEVSQDRLIWVSAATITSSDSGGMDTEVGTKARFRSRSRKTWPAVALMAVGLPSLIGLVWFFQDSSSQGAPQETEAILRVLKEDDRVSKANIQATGARETPSVYARAINEYVFTMQSADISDCPAEFRVAYRRHLEAWLELRIAVKSLPDTAAEGFIVGMLNGYLYGEKDGGLSRMAATVQQGSQNVKESHEQVENIAVKYNAALP